MKFFPLLRTAEFDQAVFNLLSLMKGNHFENSQMKETKKVKWLKEMNHIGEESLLRKKLSAVRSLGTTSKNTIFYADCTFK